MPCCERCSTESSELTDHNFNMMMQDSSVPPKQFAMPIYYKLCPSCEAITKNKEDFLQEPFVQRLAHIEVLKEVLKAMHQPVAWKEEKSA